jgi:hypothetical protein
VSRITRSVFTPSNLRIVWRTLMHGIVDPYRPELHYMRGPARNGVKGTPTLLRSCRSRVTSRLVDQLVWRTGSRGLARFGPLRVTA